MLGEFADNVLGEVVVAKVRGDGITASAGPLLLLACILATSCTSPSNGSTGTTSPMRSSTSMSSVRDPRLWPFASTSIWNMPIGGEAQLVPAHIAASAQIGNFAEEEVIVLEPHAPMVDLLESDADWNPARDRCVPEPGHVVIDRVPIPTGFVTEPKLGTTDDHAATVLRPDGRTLHQSQPLVRCSNGTATTHYRFDDGDLYGDGVAGAHGGSGLSALGGTIRLGELVPHGTIHHALKIVIQPRYYHYDRAESSPGFRWPATTADGHASLTYTGQEPALEMGSLLALPPDFDLDALKTEPARIIARAAKDYGIYVVDSAGFDSYSLAIEWRPFGRVIDEFQREWSMPFVQEDLSHPWSTDLAAIVTHLAVVANNGPEAPGGGGNPRVPLAPALAAPG